MKFPTSIFLSLVLLASASIVSGTDTLKNLPEAEYNVSGCNSEGIQPLHMTITTNKEGQSIMKFPNMVEEDGTIIFDASAPDLRIGKIKVDGNELGFQAVGVLKINNQEQIVTVLGDTYNDRFVGVMIVGDSFSNILLGQVGTIDDIKRDYKAKTVWCGIAISSAQEGKLPDVLEDWLHQDDPKNLVKAAN